MQTIQSKTRRSSRDRESGTRASTRPARQELAWLPVAASAAGSRPIRQNHAATAPEAGVPAVLRRSTAAPPADGVNGPRFDAANGSERGMSEQIADTTMRQLSASAPSAGGGPVIRRVFANMAAAGQALGTAPLLQALGLTLLTNAGPATTHPNMLWSNNNKPIVYSKRFDDREYLLVPLVAGRNDDGVPDGAFFVRINDKGATSGFCDAAANILPEVVDPRAGWIEEDVKLVALPNTRDDLVTLTNRIRNGTGNIYETNIRTVVGGHGAKSGTRIDGVAPSARIDRQNPPRGAYSIHFQFGGVSVAAVIFTDDDAIDVVMDKLLESFDHTTQFRSPHAPPPKKDDPAKK